MKKRGNVISFFNKNEDCRIAKINLTLVFIFLILVVLVSSTFFVSASTCSYQRTCQDFGSAATQSTTLNCNPDLCQTCGANSCETDCNCLTAKKSCEKLSDTNNNLKDIVGSMGSLNDAVLCPSQGELAQLFPVPTPEMIEPFRRAAACFEALKSIGDGLSEDREEKEVAQRARQEAERARIELEAKMKELAKNEAELNNLEKDTNSFFNDLKKCADETGKDAASLKLKIAFKVNDLRILKLYYTQQYKQDPSFNNNPMLQRESKATSDFIDLQINVLQGLSSYIDSEAFNQKLNSGGTELPKIPNPPLPKMDCSSIDNSLDLNNLPNIKDAVDSQKPQPPEIKEAPEVIMGTEYPDYNEYSYDLNNNGENAISDVLISYSGDIKKVTVDKPYFTNGPHGSTGGLQPGDLIRPKFELTPKEPGNTIDGTITLKVRYEGEREYHVITREIKINIIPSPTTIKSNNYLSTRGNQFGARSLQSSNSVYMIRKASQFDVNGDAYIVSPKINFSVPVEVNFDYSNYGSENEFKTYKYSDEQEVLILCDNNVLKSASKIISPDGGSINFDEMIMTFPKNSVLNNINISIVKYNLSNCNSQDIVLNITDVNEKIVSYLSILQATEVPLKSNYNIFINMLVVIAIVAVILVVVLIIYRARNRR
jgi:hypothetical protein